MPKKAYVIDDIDDFFRAEQMAQGFAAAKIKPWQRDLKPGDHFVRFSNGIAIYSKVMPIFEEDAEGEETDVEKSQADSDFRFTKSYSAACPDGELGDVHISTVFKQITEGEFKSFQSRGWPHRKNVVLAVLGAN